MLPFKVAKQTVFDRIIAWANPQRGLKRLQARTALNALTGNGGYKGGKKGRRGLSTWLPGEGSANADTVPELPELRSRARDLRRNVPTATGAIATNVTNVVGEGLRCQPAVNRTTLNLTPEQAEAFNKAALEEFELACCSADYSRRQAFSEMQGLALGSILDSGDLIALRRFRVDPGDTYGTKLQLIEADRLSNPNFGMDTDTLVAGVEHHQSGWPTAYHISDRHPGDVLRKALKWRRVPARYNDGRPIVLHLYDILRPDQARGVPYLAPVIDAFKSLGDYTDAEVRAAVVSAYFTVFVKGSIGDDGPLPTAEGTGSDGNQEVELGPGAVIGLADGEEIQTANPMRPNALFDPFVQAFLRQIGVALELPFELLIKHFTASYSASRAALEMAWQTFRKRRSWLASRFCQPYYEMVIEEAIVRGRLKAPGFFDDAAIRKAWLTTEWVGPVKFSLDPKKDAEADKLDLENRTKTRKQIVTERTGGNADSKIEQLGHEEKLIAENGLSAAAEPAEPAAVPEPETDDEGSDDES